jgi:hypothetical protein
LFEFLAADAIRRRLDSVATAAKARAATAPAAAAAVHPKLAVLAKSARALAEAFGPEDDANRMGASDEAEAPPGGFCGGEAAVGGEVADEGGAGAGDGGLFESLAAAALHRRAGSVGSGLAEPADAPALPAVRQQAAKALGKAREGRSGGGEVLMVPLRDKAAAKTQAAPSPTGPSRGQQLDGGDDEQQQGVRQNTWCRRLLRLLGVRI